VGKTSNRRCITLLNIHKALGASCDRSLTSKKENGKFDYHRTLPK
jgi:hypothetical protein